MNFLAPDKIPCERCGRQEKGHRERCDFRRREDNQIKFGYNIALSLCAGYTPKKNERSNRDNHYSGLERRNLHPVLNLESLSELLAKLKQPI